MEDLSPSSPQHKKEPGNSLPMKVVGCIITMLLAATAGAIVLAFVPFFSSDRKYETLPQQERRLNNAAIHFKARLYLGAALGTAGGALLWWRMIRKQKVIP